MFNKNVSMVLQKSKSITHNQSIFNNVTFNAKLILTIQYNIKNNVMNIKVFLGNELWTATPVVNIQAYRNKNIKIKY